LSPNFPPGQTRVSSINSQLRQHLGSIVSAGLAAVDARRATTRALEQLSASVAGERAIRVVAAGKAAFGMGLAAQEALGDRFASGVMTASVDPELPHWRTHAATHPTPSAASERAGRDALALADATRTDGGLLVVCLSGGASAMLAVPADGLSIADKVGVTSALLRAGLDIGAINCVRRHLSGVKGGQLAARAGRTLTLAISDVSNPVEDDPAVIGSGPTVGDSTTFEDALAVLARASITDAVPRAVVAHLEAGAAGGGGPVPPGDSRLRSAAYWVIASRRDAMRAAADVATRLGYHTQIVDPPTRGEARDAAPILLAEAARLPRPACLIAGGETTVRVVGRGRGGRNQELALAAIEQLARLGPAALASVGTDGVDGPTDAAGAFVDSGTWAAAGPDARAAVDRALADNDSYPLLERLDALIRTGPTGTNVGDLQVVLLAGDRPSVS
jgi:glycerate 2-kinase